MLSLLGTVAEKAEFLSDKKVAHMEDGFELPDTSIFHWVRIQVDPICIYIDLEHTYRPLILLIMFRIKMLRKYAFATIE